MRILLCSPFNSENTDNPGGIIVWTKNIIEYYDSNDSFNDLELDLYDLDRSVYVHKSLGMISRFTSGIKDYFNHCISIWKLLSDKHYDIIHLSSSASLSLFKDWVIMRIARWKGVRAIVHFHFGRIPELQLKNNWEWRLLKKIVSLADEVIVMDERSESVLKEFSANVHNVPNPLSIGVERYVNGEECEKRIDRQILFVGHVVKSKGIYDLVNACKALQNVRLKIIGKVLEEDKQRIIASAGTDEWIEFAGTVSHYEVLREMQRSSVFVLPSYTEGFPNVIIESMYCGCPIVATDVGAIPEMLDAKNGQNCGMCVPVGSVEQLKAAIELILDNPEYAESCGNHAKERVLKEYSMDSVWQSLNKIWSDEY